MPSKIEPLLERNRAFAATDARANTPRLPFLPTGASTSSPASTPAPTPQSFSACASPRRSSSARSAAASPPT
jgi:hypothetical protein